MPAVDGTFRVIDSALVPEAAKPLTESVPTAVSDDEMVAFDER